MALSIESSRLRRTKRCQAVPGAKRCQALGSWEVGQRIH